MIYLLARASGEKMFTSMRTMYGSRVDTQEHKICFYVDLYDILLQLAERFLKNRPLTFNWTANDVLAARQAAAARLLQAAGTVFKELCILRYF